MKRLRWRVRATLVLFLLVGLAWAFDEWQAGPRLLVARLLVARQGKLRCEVCLRRRREQDFLSGDLTLECRFHDLWKRPIDPPATVVRRYDLATLFGPRAEQTVEVELSPPDNARFLSVRYRDQWAT